jgi:hypothetical protein
MAEKLTGWNPDPWGVHELRYFSMGGTATRLVSDDGKTSHDPPPSHLSETVEPAFDLVDDPGSEPIEDHANALDASSVPPSIVASLSSRGEEMSLAEINHHREAEQRQGEINQLRGWQPDLFGRFPHRWFKNGQPTALVRDGDRETYDRFNNTLGEQG